MIEDTNSACFLEFVASLFYIQHSSPIIHRQKLKKAKQIVQPYSSSFLTIRYTLFIFCFHFLPKSRVDLKEFKQNETRYGRNNHPNKEVLITNNFLQPA